MSGFSGYGGGYGPPQPPPGGYYPPHTQPLPHPQHPPYTLYPQPMPPQFPPQVPFGYPQQQPPPYAYAPPTTLPQQPYPPFANPSPHPGQTSPTTGPLPPQQQQPPRGQPQQQSPGSQAGSHNSAPLPLPPTGAQQFGHGAPPSYAYQYSRCTGIRKALLIGINYFGQRGQLRGCINDVRNMSAYLVTHFGYKREDMVILTDDQQNPMSQPTKQNILRAMHWLVKDARPNDALFFHYSGHGGQTKDLDGDEVDGYDEVIYPVDFRQTGHITDDEMHRIMVQPLQAGVRLTAIFDSCHSGTALDLPYIYSTQGIMKAPDLAREAGEGLLQVVSSGSLSEAANGFTSLLKRAATGQEAHERTMMTKTSPADVVMFSGSKDNQTSADENTGAMSWAFMSALKKNPQQSYVQLLNSIRDELSTRYTQRPQLSCSHPLAHDAELRGRHGFPDSTFPTMSS
ncbi:hypothetical protein SAPIO_CDS4502 [Scedosporium apiospermum]|uniref:Peptidase C14 caspase domain-containing protein n=1 Tax=Pseudallescheria apiosperma TaxID=563466 RepID=A0A084G8B5_PSEDA|nr:uncharacterized protein SAPIO_CDS4502 [Scedosporium apiospermum]KEZ43577.1 hypothetical protein SAPIO_CDS4502 [Scedosporium apiospermum]